jgi:hypothetical protein
VGTGPILILDKSTFQMLSAREHLRRSIHFFENVTLILVTEILGDLSKVLNTGQDPAAKVAELAGKFHGSGGPVNHDAHLLAVQSLIGTVVPMTGQVLAQGGRRVDDQQLGRGFFIDLTWWNEAILRWQRSQFSDVEKHTSELWRQVSRQPGFSSLWDSIRRHGIILPKINFTEDLASVLQDVTTDSTLQDAWFEILLERLHVTGAEEAYTRRRWAALALPLSTFAPYAHHCLRVWVALVIVVHHRLFKWAPTHIVFGYRVGAKSLTAGRRVRLGVRMAWPTNHTVHMFHQPQLSSKLAWDIARPAPIGWCGQIEVMEDRNQPSATILRHDEIHQPFSIRDVAPVRTLHPCHFPARIHCRHIRLDEFDADDGIVKRAIPE